MKPQTILKTILKRTLNKGSLPKQQLKIVTKCYENGLLVSVLDQLKQLSPFVSWNSALTSGLLLLAQTSVCVVLTSGKSSQNLQTEKSEDTKTQVASSRKLSHHCSSNIPPRWLWGHQPLFSSICRAQKTPLNTSLPLLMQSPAVEPVRVRCVSRYHAVSQCGEERCTVVRGFQRSPLNCVRAREELSVSGAWGRERAGTAWTCWKDTGVRPINTATLKAGCNALWLWSRQLSSNPFSSVSGVEVLLSNSG